MFRKMKLVMIISASLILVGLIICTSVMTAYGWDFTKLTTRKYENNTYVFDKDDIKDIYIDSDTADINILPSTDKKVRVVTYLPKKKTNYVLENDGTLSINSEDGFSWRNLFDIDLNNPKITVYLPEGEYGTLNITASTGDVKISSGFTFDTVSVKVSTGNAKCYASAKGSLKIKASTGDILVKDISAGNIEITASTGDITLKDIECEGDIRTRASTGDVELKNVNCKNFSSNTSTGDCELENVFALGKINIKTDTGEVEFDRCFALEIYVKTDTGDVKGTLISDMIFFAHSDTGDVDVPKSTTGGKCEITTDTGDIKIKIAK